MDVDLLCIGDVITDLHNRVCMVVSLEVSINKYGLFVPVCYPEWDCFVSLSPDAMWRVERDGSVIYQSDAMQAGVVANEFADLPLFEDMQEGRAK